MVSQVPVPLMPVLYEDLVEMLFSLYLHAAVLYLCEGITIGGKEIVSRDRL